MDGRGVPLSVLVEFLLKLRVTERKSVILYACSGSAREDLHRHLVGILAILEEGVELVETKLVAPSQVGQHSFHEVVIELWP